jgi:O-antigen biosynthesis protein
MGDKMKGAMMRHGLSIIIVNYFSERYIEPLVTKLVADFHLDNFEVIIVSNSPSAFAWQQAYMQSNRITVIDTHSNEGFGRGINRGASAASYDCICMVNPDMDFEAGTLQQLYETFSDACPDVGAASCTVKTSDGSDQINYFMNKRLSRARFAWSQIRNTMPGRLRRRMSRSAQGAGSVPETVQKERFEVAGFYGSFVLVRKRVFDEIGGFDPDFFMYAEDTDLFRTRFPRQYRCMMYPEFEVTHFQGKTDRYGLMSFQSKVSYLLYLRKAGNFFLMMHLLGSFKYGLLLLSSVVRKRDDAEEAIEFFRSLRYLGTILRYPRGYGTLPGCLKISEISD